MVWAERLTSTVVSVAASSMSDTRSHPVSCAESPAEGRFWRPVSSTRTQFSCFSTTATVVPP